MYGYRGKILHVNLTYRGFKQKYLDKGFVRKWLGATGFGVKLLMDLQKPRIEAFHPDNPLIFALGPFTGTMVPCSSKFGVFAKSPLSNFLGEAYSSGFWGVELKRAGYDALVIEGKADKPIYLYIEDDEVYFMDASHLWGETTWETEDKIRSDLGDYDVRVAAIGPAGERLVRFACIINDRYRAAGRTGLGAVMGSKMLKAVAVKGSQPVKVAEPDILMEECLKLNLRLQKSPATSKYRNLGTSANMLILNTAAALPTRNYREAMFDKVLQVSGEVLNERFVAKIQACPVCPMRCEHVAEIREGRFKGSTVRVEYEPLWALGPYCGIGELDCVIKAIELCDLYGLDALSTGVAVGFAMECFSRGLISPKDTDGLRLEFGNSEALISLLELIAFRKGIGGILAEGVKRASHVIGGEEFAMHVKGVEMTGYDVRGLKTAALGYAVSRRGAHHQTHGAYGFDLSGKVDRFKAEKERGRLVMTGEDRYVVFDSLPLCKFTRSVWKGFDEIAYFYQLVTGIQLSGSDLLKSGERISNLARIYNIREGLTKSDDTLPPRIMKDPIPQGPAKGSRVTSEELKVLLSGYYEARGWDENGVPKSSKLRELGLEEYIPMLKNCAEAR